MIGWWIIISTQSPEERDNADRDGRRAAILAQWEVGASGIRWLADLVTSGKALQLAAGAYPNRYTAKAVDVLPLIKGGGIKPPENGVWIFGIHEGEEDTHFSNWPDKLEVHKERILACKTDQILTIDAWDLS
jgi:hypothetical protein